MSEHTYKIIELVGTSGDGIEEAVRNAVSQASQTLRHLDWFEVREIRGNISDGQPDWFQVKIGVGFRVMSPEDVEQEG